MLGRRAERAEMDRLLAGAAAGRSGVLVVRGEAGVGKSTLLDHARATAPGFRVLRVVGVDAESGFTFAGLHRLCAPVLDRADVLPVPQREALRVALGVRTGDRPDPFLVGLAALGLLATVSDSGPVLCVVDDAQWLDTASLQVIAFVARRLDAERVAMVFGVREPGGVEAGAQLADLPTLRLAALPDADARALLSAHVHEPLDELVRDRIVTEARGNPLAILELARYAGPAGLAGGLGLPSALAVPDAIEDRYGRRTAALPPTTRLALLVAAAEPTGEPTLFWRAAKRLGVAPEDLEPALSAGLLEVAGRVTFTHPLARSAVYRVALPADRRRVHGVLAEATDAVTDPDRRTWHRSHAVLGTDEEIAAELVVAAQRARARGGTAETGVLLERSAELTPDAPTRARRTLDAAFATYEAGASDAALDLLAVAARGPLDPLHHARAELLRAQVALHTTRTADVPELLLIAAESLASLDAALSRETFLQALQTAMLVGDSAEGPQAPRVAERALAAPAAPEPTRPTDLLLGGLTQYHLQGYEASVPALSEAVRAFRSKTSGPPGGGAGSSGRWLACHTAMALWDDDAVHDLAVQVERHDRTAGALTTLPFALNFHAAVLVHAGELERVADLLDEADSISAATAGTPIPHSRLQLAAWRGDRAETLRLHREVVEEALQRGVGEPATVADYALAVLHNGLGDPEHALAAALRVRDPGEMVHARLVLPELVEAAARAGRPESATWAVDELAEQARVTGEPWALGLAARSRALSNDGPAAEDAYREAIEHLARTRMTIHLARARLVYGEWLRRAGRRRDAREELRAAHVALSAMGADGFAARAGAELRATGEHPRKRQSDPTGALTAQELRIARLVATGATSKEVAAQLFLSPRTVDAHLRHIFPKLGVTSRRQLRDLPLT